MKFPTQPIVVKLGGSVITHKEKESTINQTNLRRLLTEIHSTGIAVVIVHGGGSFGHILAQRYSVTQGRSCSTPWAASLVMHNMACLNNLVVNEMLDVGFAPLTFPPHALLSDNLYFPSASRRLLEHAYLEGFTPVTFGDVVLDHKTGFKILSGDYLAAQLAIILKADALIFGTAVDGVYPDFSAPDLSPYTEIDQHTKFSTLGSDATGGIRFKVKQALRAAKVGIRTWIVNADKPSLLAHAITNQDILCTRVVWRR